MNIIKKDTTVERAYDMRAQPRRRPKEENEQPLFLKKAFTMIDKCPPHLGKRKLHLRMIRHAYLSIVVEVLMIACEI
jgi:hypothetical protein